MKSFEQKHDMITFDLQKQDFVFYRVKSGLRRATVTQDKQQVALVIIR